MSGSFRPFALRAGTTPTISASTTKARAALVEPTQGKTVDIVNLGTVPAYVVFGGSSVTATVAAGYGIPGGQRRIVTLPAGATHVAAITVSSTASVQFTTGVGT